MVFDTLWSICAFSRPVILINSNSAVDVKITWTVELLVIRITGLEKAQMDQKVANTIYIIELAAAKPPPTLRYTSFLMLFGAFGLVSSTVSLINSNSKVHVIFTWLM